MKVKVKIDKKRNVRYNIYVQYVHYIKGINGTAGEGRSAAGCRRTGTESYCIAAHFARNRRIRQTVIYQLTKNRKDIARKGSFLAVYFFETEAKK